MSNGTTQRSDLIIPTLLSDEISKGIAGMNILAGTGAFSVNPGLQASQPDVGRDITVPYFDSIGKAQQVAAGGALTPKKQSMSSESAVVVHIGDAVSISGWAQRAKATGRSLYDVAREQLLAGMAAKIEDLCMDALVTRAVAASMVYDGSTANMTTAAIVGALKLFGDELELGGPPVLWGMQSKPYWDAATLADSTGRTIYTAAQGETLARLGGVPVKMSDRATLQVASTSPQQYYNILAKRGAGAIWINQNVTIEFGPQTRDALADVDMLVYHCYLVIHVYGTMAGGTKAGVAAAKTL